MRAALGLIMLTLGCPDLLSQQLLPRGEFLTDSLRIGEEVPYSLSIQYPREMEVLFPDSSFDYSPFEYVRKEYFTSRVDSASVTDSVLYHLASFEIDPVQYFSLPVFLISEGDSTGIKAPIDSIYLIEMIPVLPDSVALKESVSYFNVDRAFNYPYLLIGAGVLIIILVIVYFAFGEVIRKKIRLYRLEKNYKKFVDEFDLSFSHLRQNESSLGSEQLLIIWKKYMERLEDRPYTKLTSREIGKLSDAGELKNILSDIDKSIYSTVTRERVFKSFESLEDITGERYQKKVWEVKHG